jgi:hypothetical protein
MRALFVLFSIILLFVSLAHAQESTPEPDDGWTIEQRCIGEPTTPPDDWTFDGTILTLDETGVHGIRSDWETPHVLAFTDTENGNYLMGHSYSLSPDMRWMAEAKGHVQCGGTCMMPYITVTYIQIFDLSGEAPREYITLEWDFHYADHSLRIDTPVITWIDNEHFVYPYMEHPSSSEWGPMQLRIVNPFTGEMQEWTDPIDPSLNDWDSPDFTRLIWRDSDFAANTEYFFLTDSDNQILLEFETPQFQPLPDWAAVWSPDSAYFLGVDYSDAVNDNVRLLIYDRNGDLVSPILSFINQGFPEPEGIGLEWSPNSHSFAIRLEVQPDDDPQTLDYTVYIVDLEDQHVIDLCTNALYSPVWSPDSQSLAFRTAYTEQVIVFDTQTQELYTVASETGFPIGWRAND